MYWIKINIVKHKEIHFTNVSTNNMCVQKTIFYVTIVHKFILTKKICIMHSIVVQIFIE